MRKERLIVFVLALTVLTSLIVSCRREDETPTPTMAATAIVAEDTPTVEPTSTRTPTREPSRTPPPAAETPASIDPADIDWAPEVVQSSPAPGEESLLNGAITIRFDQPMDQQSVEAAFQVTDPADDAAVDGQFDWPKPDTLIFTPGSRLERGATYSVRLDSEARSRNGVALVEPVTLQFETVGFLEIAQTIPGDGATEIDTDGSITLIFNRPVVPLVASGQQADLPDPIRIQPDAAGTGQWVSTSIYRFTPDAPLSGATSYEVTVPSGLEDVTGGLLEDDYSFTFSTLEPSVALIEPANGDTDVIPTLPLTVTFNMPMNQDSVAAALSLEPATTYDLTWSEDGRTVNVVPDDRLSLDTRYTLTVGEGALAASGQASLDRATSSSFTTVPFPAVASTNPREGEEVPPFQFGIQVEFASPMDPETIRDRFVISPAPEDEVDYFIHGEGRYVNLNFELERDTAYEVTIPADVADLYGNTLGSPYTWRFRTAPPSPIVSLNLPRQVSQLSNSYPTQVDLIYRGVSTVNGSLYDLGLPADLLVNPFRVDELAAPGSPVRTWSLPVPNVPNAADTLTLDLAGQGDTLPLGVYFLRVDSPELDSDTRFWQNQRQIMIVADTNVVVKEMFGAVHVWVTDLESGQPVSGRELVLYGENGSSLGQATSDANGFASFDYEPAENFLSGAVVIAGAPGEPGFGVGSSQWDQGVSPWEYSLNATTVDEQPEFAYIYTDRPIYRPGDTVYFRGIVRDSDYARYQLPQRESVTARIEFFSFFEPSQELDFETTLGLDANGTFSGEYVLPETADLGQYRLYLEEEAEIGQSSRTFTVAQYRRPEFFVNVVASEDELLRGDTVDVAVEARYFFGAPATDLPVEWVVRERAYSFPWQGRFYSFDDRDDFFFAYGGPDEGFFGESVLSGQGRTDGEGRLEVTLPADLLEDVEDGSRLITFEATIRDLSEFPISGRTQVVFHDAQVYAGIAPQDYLNVAGVEASVDLITVDWVGEIVPDQSVEVIFYEREYQYVEERQFGTTFGRWEPEDTEVAREQITTNAEGEGVASFVPENGGTYRAVAIVTDGDGNSHRSGVLFWVADSDFVAWRVNPEDKRMDITPDQRSYAVGDTARVLVQSPFTGPVNAWLIIERGSLIEQRLITLQTNSDVVEIPITEAFPPNAFITVVAVKGIDESNQYADLRIGMTEIVVPPDQLTLNVELTPQSDSFGPGETVTYDIRITDFAGRPVQAEFSLALVDLAVLTLQPDNAPPIVEAFYQRQPYRSRLGSGLIISGEGLEVEVPSEQLGLGGGGGEATQDAARALEEEDGVRRDFPDTAFWNASIQTDGNGQATVDIPLPDTLTTWRLSSKAVAQETLVGQSRVDITTTLPLLIRPVTPRFFTVNDVLQIGAIINNNTGSAIDVDVSLEANGLALNGDADQTVSVPANGQALVRWPVTVEDVTHVDLTLRASGGGYSDATKPSFGEGPDNLIPVHRYDAEDIVGTSGVIDEAGQRVEAILLPPNVNTREGSLDIDATASLAGAIVDALDYEDEVDIATACAHGVVDQFMPNLAAARAFRQLGLDDPQTEAALDELVEASISRLGVLQRADGGWSWCYSNEVDEYLTAYVLFGLAKAQEAGYDISAVDVDRALAVLEIANPQDLTGASEVNRQAWFLYVRAEFAATEEAELDALFDEQRELLDPHARAYMALAYDLVGASGRNSQEALLSDLSNSAVLSATGAHWEDAQPDWNNLSSDIRGTAVVLDALARLEPDNPLAPSAVRWLMAARRANRWPTPFETAWSVLAVSDWMAATGELDADYDYVINVNGRELETDSFSDENLLETTSVSVPLRNLLEEDVNYLIFNRGEGPGRFYYTTHMDAFIDAEAVEAVDRGMSVERVFYDADCDAEADGCEPIDEIAAGERVRVELTLVAPNDLTYVRLEDPIPAGGEAVDPGLATSASGLGGTIAPSDAQYQFGYWGWWRFDRIEYRDDRVVFLSNFLPAGTYQYTYYLETAIPGEYQVRPAIAYEEFFPEVFGRSDGRLFTITAE